MTKEQHRQIVKTIIQKCFENGVFEYITVLNSCDGADPRLVSELFEELKSNSEEDAVSGGNKNKTSKKNDSSYSNLLPAPDPKLCQWWFSHDAQNYFLESIKKQSLLSPNPTILCIGCPTIAVGAAERGYTTTLLDFDKDVITAVNNKGNKKISASFYDLAVEISTKISSLYDIAVVDPPWYEDHFKTSINRALGQLNVGGVLYCTLPGKLTRPNIDNFRTDIIGELIKLGHKIVSFENDNILYEVPNFEFNSLKNIEGFNGVPWRKGDLLLIEKVTDNLLEIEKELTPLRIKSFSRNPKEFRVFMDRDVKTNSKIALKTTEKFNVNISSREIDSIPNFWTTSKKGLLVNDLSNVKAIMQHWANGESLEGTIEKMASDNFSVEDASDYVIKIENEFELWSKYSAKKVFKTSEEIKEEGLVFLSDYSVKENSRIFPDYSDNYRSPFSRDRDRIIWSNSFRALSDKTQLFPGRSDDSVRRRLTHTLEVSQLATTIGSSLGLNNELIEACALAHDLGHTPFGHAGESAINDLFDFINPGLNGFNHYEHGLDVINYIESPYIDEYFGLNLSIEVQEAILKHTYKQTGDSPLSASNLVQRSKHKIEEGFCHLEGQAVRLADKISYFISDLEDGLRLKVLSLEDLKKCRFFHHPSLNFSSDKSISDLQKYLGQRKNTIKILMEDAINFSTISISQTGVKNANEARTAKSLLITQSNEIQGDIDYVWKNLQTGILFNDRRVASASLFAGKIVTELIIIFTLLPELIDPEFIRRHSYLKDSQYMAKYDKVNVSLKKNLLGFLPIQWMIGKNHPVNEDINDVATYDLIRAKDFVTTLGDNRARYLHNQIINDLIDS